MDSKEQSSVVESNDHRQEAVNIQKQKEQFHKTMNSSKLDPGE